MSAATNALAAYGYALRNGRWVRPGKRSQEWEETDGGFLRFDPEGQIPFALLPAFQGLSGIGPERSEAWDWVWPAGHVEAIYAAGAEHMAVMAAEAAIRKAAQR